MSAAAQMGLFEARPGWSPRNKGDPRCRELADRHYTRQSPGHPMWTRPGYNFVLFAEDARGAAVFCWWRPKWEAGQERRDGLRVLECTIFRNETGDRSSDLIRQAVTELGSDVAREELGLDPVGIPLVTAVSSEATRKHRGRRHLPGHCFRMAGWVEFEHRVGRGDVWLWLPIEGRVCP